ncbi:hypothetical protein DPMN_100967 [Dreissena polymorpha]|uniref:Uncharacterized protein n=1 Tax=Dreissena polymorpha TaxID=45954 RepID=A0A9D4R7W8_DREPO|nr:hypothetical protein DPMN_100967 [Dreissena polymorpha]
MGRDVHFLTLSIQLFFSESTSLKRTLENSRPHRVVPGVVSKPSQLSTVYGRQ